MTIEALTVLIFATCNLPGYSFREKQVCVEVITNCAVVGAGEVSESYQDCLTKGELK